MIKLPLNLNSLHSRGVFLLSHIHRLVTRFKQVRVVSIVNHTSSSIVETSLDELNISDTSAEIVAGTGIPVVATNAISPVGFLVVNADVDVFDGAEETISVDVVFGSADCNDVVIDMTAVGELDPVNKVNGGSEVILVVVGELVSKPLAEYVEGVSKVMVEILEFLVKCSAEKSSTTLPTVVASKLHINFSFVLPLRILKDWQS